MKLLLVLSAVSLLTSCGRSPDAYIFETKYDDSKLLAYELIQDARIKALEDRLPELAVINSTLTNIQQQVTLNKVEVLKICASNEHLIKINNVFYAVYMVSNNYGTYLGKLDNNVQYRTTDSVASNFKIMNNSITCL